MKTIINFIKRLVRLFKKEKEPKLSVAQIDELIELNKDVLTKLNDWSLYHFASLYFAVMIKYILSFFKPKKVKVEESINNVHINEYMGDFLDYDGMGNWGRFPPIKNQDKWKIFLQL